MATVLSDPGTSRRRILLGLGTLLALTTALRLFFGYHYFGFHTGDDVEVLQGGFMRALGLPYHPWAIRNLLVSDALVAPVLAGAAAAGVRSPLTLTWIASWPFVALATLNAWWVFRLGVRYRESLAASASAACLYALHWIPLGYGSTVYPRTASTSLVLLAALAVASDHGSYRKAGLAGALIGVAWAIRYSEVIFLPSLCLVLCLSAPTRRKRVLLASSLLGGFAVASVFSVGLEDLVTWGRPFASLMAFADYTLIQRQASSLFPHQPWYWYLWRLPRWLPLTVLPFLLAARKSGPAARDLACFVGPPLLVLSVIDHKRLRYLQGLLPFVLLLAVAGASIYWRRHRRGVVLTLMAISILWGVRGLGFLQQKSMAAVLAAEHLHQEARPGAQVCLSQPWAYGADLFLGSDLRIVDLPYPLAASSLRAVASRCDWLALYQEDLDRQPSLVRVLSRNGLTALESYRYSHSKPVTVFGHPSEVARRAVSVDSHRAGRGFDIGSGLPPAPSSSGTRRCSGT